MATVAKYTPVNQLEMKITDAYDFLFKVIVVGDSGFGKSCLLVCYVDDMFIDSFIATIGVDFRFSTLCSPEITANKTVKMQIWDTAGQDRFRFIVANYFRKSHSVLFCADLTDKQSFENLAKWQAEVLRCNPDGVVGCVVGTKADLTGQRAVSRAEAEEYASKMGYPYFETSSKQGTMVGSCFESLVPQMISRKVAQHADLSTVDLKLGHSKPLLSKKRRFFGFCNII